MSCQIESLEDRQETENIIKNLKSDPKITILLNLNMRVTSTANVQGKKHFKRK